MTRAAGRNLLLFATLGHIAAYLYAAPEHVVDASWPDHARFHVLQAIFWVVGFNLTLVPLIVGPAMRGEGWAVWTLGLGGLFVQGGYFFALLYGGGPPEWTSHAALALLLLLFAAGWFVMWRSIGRDET